MFGFGRQKKAPALSGQKDQSGSAPSSGIKGSLISLEQRLMFDAAAAATASEVATERVAQEQAEAAVSSDSAGSEGQAAERAESQGVLAAIASYNPGESRSEVVFVDSTVPNYQELLAGMDPHIEVVMLDGGTDGVQQIASALAGRTGIDAIHIISHGSAGELHLDTGVLNTETMSDRYANDLATIQHALSEQADVLVYGCDFAKGDAGQVAVDTLAQLTGADVEASTDLTGSISLGGDWDFEMKTGSIETSLAISYDAQMNWAEVLGKESVSDTFSAKSYGNNDGTRSWSSNWSEADVGSSRANGGHIKVDSGQLRIDTVTGGESVNRGVDLSGAKSATLSFDYTNSMSKSGSVEVRVSTDGGANYRTLSDGTFSKTSHTGNGTASFDLSGAMSANTKIQFLVTGSSGGDRLTIDNVQVDYNVADTNKGETKGQTASDMKGQSEKGEIKGQAEKDDTKSLTAASDTKGQTTASDSKGQGDKGHMKSQSDKGETKGQSEKGDVKGQTASDTKGQTTASVSKDQTDKGDVKGQSEKGDAKEQSDKGNTKGQSDRGETKDQTEKGEAKGQPDKAEVKGQADKGEVKGQSEKGETKGQGDLKGQTVANDTKGQTTSDSKGQLDKGDVKGQVSSDTKDQSEKGEVKGQGKPVVELVVGPVSVVEPIMTEPAEVVVEPAPVVEVAEGSEPVVDSAVTELVVEMTAGPDPVVDPIVTEPVEMVVGSAPVVDPVVPEPAVEVAASPDPVVAVAVGPAPVVEVTAGPVPVVNPVATEQVGGAPNVNVRDTKMHSPGVDQTLIASLHQLAPVGPEISSPRVSAQGPLNGISGDQVDFANNPGKSIDAQPEPVVQMEISAPAQSASTIVLEGRGEQLALSGKDGMLSSSSSTKAGASGNSNSGGTQDSARFVFGQVPWPPTEETEQVPDDSEGLAMPMAVGLMGAVVQGSLRKKEKLTALNSQNPTPEQQPGKEKNSEQPATDDKEAPPSAA